MNAERPIYEDRTFYGPLKLATDAPQSRDRYMMEHPDDSSKMVRASGKGAYYDQQEMDELVYTAQQALEGLSKHGICHVNPSYINETNEKGEPSYLMVVTRLGNFQPYSDLLAKDRLNEEQVNEANQTINNMLEYTAQVIREGGYVVPEMMRLKQFVYDDSRPRGQKMVLIDVEAIGGSKIDINADSMEYGLPGPLVRILANLIADAINLIHRAGDRSITSLEKAARAVEELPGSSLATNEAKTILLHALDIRQITPEMMSLLANDEFSDDDEVWEA